MLTNQQTSDFRKHLTQINWGWHRVIKNPPKSGPKFQRFEQWKNIVHERHSCIFVQKIYRLEFIKPRRAPWRPGISWGHISEAGVQRGLRLSQSPSAPLIIPDSSFHRQLKSSVVMLGAMLWSDPNIKVRFLHITATLNDSLILYLVSTPSSPQDNPVRIGGAANPWCHDQGQRRAAWG